MHDFSLFTSTRSTILELKEDMYERAGSPMRGSMMSHTYLDVAAR